MCSSDHEYTHRIERIINVICNDKERAAVHWTDWTWQIEHTIEDINILNQLFPVRSFNESVLSEFPMKITPYYLSLIDESQGDKDPVYLQCVPQSEENDSLVSESIDPLMEEKYEKVPGVIHRYDDRVVLLLTDVCAVHCRHCSRKRKKIKRSGTLSLQEIQGGIDYIREKTSVRDVILSGGDPLMLPDRVLKDILDELSMNDNVDIIRIGTRMPVVCPFRITDELAEMLSHYSKLWIFTHFNHTREMTNEAEKALKALTSTGIPVGNQTVLLAGVNDTADQMINLCRTLVKYRVRPYYLYRCDNTDGLSHFRTPLKTGRKIINQMNGVVSGFAIPRYVVDSSLGKQIFMPDTGGLADKNDEKLNL